MESESSSIALEQQIKELIEENLKLQKRVTDLEAIVNGILDPNYNINRLKTHKSAIMHENEFNLIGLNIKSRCNKTVKHLKKIYQASIDGDNVIAFHSKCDNIPNTLVLVKTAGNRRFGGFTTSCWASPDKGEWNVDPNAFVFSLDKQKIYTLEPNKGAVYNKKDSGPWFGMNGFFLFPKSKGEKNLFTFESNTNPEHHTFNYNGDKTALSEDGKNQGVFAIEYEVFEVIYE